MKKALAKEIYDDGYVTGYKDAIKEFLKLFDGFWVKIKSHQFYDPFPLEKVREEYKKIKEEIKRLKY